MINNIIHKNSRYTNDHRTLLEVGHTQCDGNSMHAAIERESKDKSVWTQDQWCDIMKDAKIDNKYAVHNVDQDGIFDFHEFADNFEWQNVRISGVREITFEPKQVPIQVEYE